MNSFSKTILIALIILLFASCFPMRAPNVSTGMTEQEFIGMTKYPERIRGDGEWTVYRVRYGYHADGTMFYYFHNNKLVKYNQGALLPNYRVTINTN